MFEWLKTCILYLRVEFGPRACDWDFQQTCAALEYARQKDERTPYWVETFREEVEENGYSLEEFGTSEKELERLLHKGYLEKAWKLLLSAQKEKDPYWVKQLCLTLRDGNLNPHDVGTSPDELSKLLKNACKNEALIVLDLLRKEGNGHNRAGMILELLKEGGWTPEDIGTSATELNTYHLLTNKLAG